MKDIFRPKWDSVPATLALASVIILMDSYFFYLVGIEAWPNMVREFLFVRLLFYIFAIPIFGFVVSRMNFRRGLLMVAVLFLVLILGDILPSPVEVHSGTALYAPSAMLVGALIAQARKVGDKFFASVRRV